MESTEYRLMMIGLPETGKTSYIAALWYVVNHPEETKSRMRLYRLDGEHRYLNQVSKKWMQFEEVDRTKIGSEQVASMELEDKDSGRIAQVFFPDLSGERFRQQVEERFCTEDYRGLVREANGALVFVHAGNIKYPAQIADAEELAQILREGWSVGDDSSLGKNEAQETPESEGESDQEEIEPEGGKNAQKAIPWSPAHMPTQVRMVELMQFVKVLAEEARRLRIAIIVSAWDLAQDVYKTPDLFLERRLPLFGQFLKTNKDAFEVKPFGISAQGGRIDKPEYRLALASRGYDASNRIIVATSEGVTRDITAPIRWLMESSSDGR